MANIVIRAFNKISLIPVIAAYLLVILPVSPALADTQPAKTEDDIGFSQWKEEFKQQALDYGIRPGIIRQAIVPLSIDSNVLKLDSNQPEFTRTIWQYLDNAISPKRIKLGQALLQKHSDLLNRIEAQYGVQREIIVAIWAMESDFGRNYGHKNVLRSLATLDYHGKRAEFAQNELLAALDILQKQHFKPDSMIGSWAGAMGQPQFTPSSYLKHAVDYDRDGTKDIWASLPDVFASIANFLSESGWRKGQDWGVEVSIGNDFDWRLNSSAYQLRFIQWKSLGVNSINGKPFKAIQRQASLFIPAGRFGPVFLVTHNFDVIKAYNNSSSYALAVAQLSRLLAGGEGIQRAWPRDEKALSRDQIIEIQQALLKAGHDPGKIDGKIGANTREAIRTWQLEQGLPGDGYANLDLLKRIRKKKSDKSAYLGSPVVKEVVDKFPKEMSRVVETTNREKSGKK